MNQMQDLSFLVRYLLEERYGKDGFDQRLLDNVSDEDDLFKEFRALVNTRPAVPASDEFINVQNRMLRSMIEKSGITDSATLPRVPLDSRISLWRGDITTLKVCAIVNAANSGMTGCWAPLHYCIDNAIHTFSGVQLRYECNRLMEEQGYEEPTGSAKVTAAYNLPAEFVIHTVGPIANGHPTETDCELLAKCYRSCLDAAKQIGCNSIAFCCISTGVFGFPQKEAAEIAVKTVREWLDSNESDMHVIFNVFSESDENIYHELLFA